MKLLHIDSSITGEQSVSRQLTASIVGALTRADPALDVARRDLAADPLPHLDLAALPGDTGEAAIASAAVLEEFLASDIVVIGAPMYNFGVPGQLKAWIDRIMIAGRTFAYTAEGPKGLARPKRVIVAVSRGGFYGVESPSAAAEHVETYLTSVFGFIGISPEFVVAEGIAVGPEQRATAIAAADRHIVALAA
ncbi:NAD(P)H-dependent oxidoreductase [Sphingobium sufflavum]|uniref:FMN-dependent NADH-azoreductase n=1 Tax=Sphingobium sufflavum TaxID=1129547 RepID=UPI001F1A9329|nr:NAD(P)H-dependent oxidoreductase [Sphingobium sufflavum]MCE7795165.1 NAD(P)H-dependent oxidoreductase [Sphingobium sufflavum]